MAEVVRRRCEQSKPRSFTFGPSRLRVPNAKTGQILGMRKPENRQN